MMAYGLPMSLALCAFAVAGCAGNGKGLDANGSPIAPGGSGSAAPLTADFDSIQENVFTPICSVCHAGGNAPQGLRLDAANSYNLLVDIPSTEVPGILRVKPGDPANSYIIQKLEGHAAVGARMPFGGPYLADDVIAVIRQWITDGAQRSTSATVPASFAVVTSTPGFNEVLTEPPPQIMIAFNGDVDVTRLHPDSVRIELLTGEAADPVVLAVPALLSVPSANPRALLLQPAHVLLSGHYRVVIRTAAPLGIADIAGEPIDTRSLSPATPHDGTDSLVTEFDVEVAP